MIYLMADEHKDLFQPQRASMEAGHGNKSLEFARLARIDISPILGGVGQMTAVTLMANMVKTAKFAHGVL
jgi:5,10-methylene-tetrahydrofolate dehydrogenase/methenyl tetrahydrofolate cyclohydrolase